MAGEFVARAERVNDDSVDASELADNRHRGMQRSKA
jgi:hypothetical protein